MLDTLFGGSLSLEPATSGIAIRVGALPLGKGKVQLFWDDARGVRTPYGELELASAAAGAIAGAPTAPPVGATRVSALFVGADPTGQPMVATGSALYPIAAAP
jgi:hypothetical protein